MEEREIILLTLLDVNQGQKDLQAILLQSYIQQYGPLNNELGEKVKQLLK